MTRKKHMSFIMKITSVLGRAKVFIEATLLQYLQPDCSLLQKPTAHCSCKVLLPYLQSADCSLAQCTAHTYIEPAARFSFNLSSLSSHLIPQPLHICGPHAALHTQCAVICKLCTGVDCALCKLCTVELCITNAIYSNQLASFNPAFRLPFTVLERMGKKSPMISFLHLSHQSGLLNILASVNPKLS